MWNKLKDTTLPATTMVSMIDTSVAAAVDGIRWEVAVSVMVVISVADRIVLAWFVCHGCINSRPDRAPLGSSSKCVTRVEI